MNEGLNQKKASTQEDAATFVERYKDEILPLLNDAPDERALVERLGDSASALDASEVKSLKDILERFETKIYDYEKAGGSPQGTRVLITANDPGTANEVREIMRVLDADPRVRSVAAVVSGLAGKQLAHEFPAFREVHEKENVLDDVIMLAEQKPIDVSIASISTRNGPESLALFAGKGSLGAKKSYLYFGGSGALGSAFELGTVENMEQIDGIFTSDALGTAILRKHLPEYPLERIHEVGELTTESLELSKADEYRRETRAALGIAPETFSVLYLGDTNSSYARRPEMDADISGNTFGKTLAAVEGLARAEPDTTLALMVRPHPRDPEKEKLLAAGKGASVPENLTVVDASAVLGMNAAAYAADVIVSIISTENFLAPLRGRRSVFLAYDEPGLGGDALRLTYGAEIIEAIRKLPGVSIASSPEELIEILAKLQNEAPPHLPDPITNAARRLADVILREDASNVVT